jgi:hypothetical protein
LSELPRMYHNKIDKDLNNNERVFSTLDITMKPIPMTGNMKVTNRLLLISMLHGAALARHWHPYWKSWQKNMPERFIFIR